MPDNSNREPTHTLIYGDATKGKSNGAASWPTPMLALLFDPRGKERPYLYTHQQEPRGRFLPEHLDGGTPVRLVVDPEHPDVIRYRVEHYIDANPKQPEAYARFRERLVTLDADIAAWGIQTIVVDSVTFMELAARKEQQYRLNASARDPRQWFGGSTDALEEVLLLQLGSLAVNVVVIAHVDDEKSDMSGAAIRVPAAPGRLSRKRGFPASYAEVYRAYTLEGEKGSAYLWQTRANDEFIAASQVGAPNPCPQDYRAIWLRGA